MVIIHFRCHETDGEGTHLMDSIRNFYWEPSFLGFDFTRDILEVDIV
jgi:hypothetical protein